MDGDGDMDILSASFADDTIAWYENNGAANPTWTKNVIATSADGAFFVFAEDMDGDGDMDIISASALDNTIAWYENNGAADPTWTAADINKCSCCKSCLCKRYGRRWGYGYRVGFSYDPPLLGMRTTEQPTYCGLSCYSNNALPRSSL